MTYKLGQRKKKTVDYLFWVKVALAILAIFFLLGSAVMGVSPQSLPKSLYQAAKGEPAVSEGQLASDSLLIGQIDSLQQLLKTYERVFVPKDVLLRSGEGMVNMRALPDTGSQVLEKIADSTSVRVLFVDQRVDPTGQILSTWARVRYKDIDGWIWGNYLGLD